MKNSKDFVADIKVVSALDFNKENFNEKLKLKVVLSDESGDVHVDYYLHIISINNLKKQGKLNRQFIDKSLFLSSFSNDKIKGFLDELKKQCKFNTGVEDIKNILKESLFE